MEYLLIIFFVYSFIGWAAEVSEAAVNTNSFVNRGFFNGPYCPVYGVGIVLMMVSLEKWKASLLRLFVGCGLVGTSLEYVTSLFLEKITHTRWWNYEKQPLNFDGRICAAFSFLWAAGGMACCKFNWFLEIWVKKFPKWQSAPWVSGRRAALAFLCFFFVADMAGAFLTVLSLQNKFRTLKAVSDKMREVSGKIGIWIYENVYSHMRKKERAKESEEVRRHYRKERKKRLLKLMEKRMILAAPGMAPDEKTLEKIEREGRQRKRKVFTRIMLSRVLWTALAILAQIAWLAAMMTSFAELSMGLDMCMIFLSVGICLYILNKNENSAYKIGWIIIILLMPIFGGVLYLFFGNKNPSRNLRNQLGRARREQKGVLRQNEDTLLALLETDERLAGMGRYLYRKTDCPVCANTKTTYYPLGELLYEDMLQELENARHFIFLEYFIVEEGVFWGSVLEILKKKAKEGVDVRMIYDDVGCLMLLPKHYRRGLEQEGISCIAFNPFKPIFSLAMNNRDHRKIMVIDGHTAYTGGVNLADEYINLVDRFGHWKDTGMKFEGDAAANFTVMFLEMWNAFRKSESDYRDYMPHRWHEEAFTGDGFVQPFGDTPLDDEPTAENLYIDILNQAVRYVYIFTPYLIISDTMRHALCMAAERGVDVKIVTPGVPDKKIIYRLTRSNYRTLLGAGVEIYEYTPGFLHAKCYVSDDKVAVVGTINMDYRSLYLHFECGACLYGTESIYEIKKDVLDTIEKSHKIEPAHIRQNIFAKVFDSVLTVFSPLV